MPSGASQPDPYARRIFWLLVLVLAGWVFAAMDDIFLPVIMGAFAAFALWPVLTRLPAKWPHGLKVLVTIIVALTAVTAFFLVLVPSLIDQFKTLVQQFPTYVDAVTGLGQQGRELLLRYGVTYEWQDLEARLISGAQSAGLAFAGWLGATLPGVFGSFLQLIIAFWVLVYALLEGPEMIAFFRDQLPAGSRQVYAHTVGTIGEVLTGFIKGMVVLGLIIGFAVGIGAWLIGMPYAVLIGLVAGILEAVPSFGPMIAGAFAVFLAIAQGPWMAVKVLVLFLIVQVVENNLIVPRVMGESLQVHPMVIFLAALVGAKFFGIVGLFLAGPLVAVLWRLWLLRTLPEEPLGAIEAIAAPTAEE